MPGVNDLNLMDIAYDLFKDYPTAGIQFAKVMTEVCKKELKKVSQNSNKFYNVNAERHVSKLNYTL